MTNAHKGLWMDKQMREAFAEYAYLHRTSMAAVVRATLEDVRDNPEDVSALSPNDYPSHTTWLNVKVDDTLWNDARDAAHQRGVVKSLNALVRRRILKLLQDERLI